MGNLPSIRLLNILLLTFLGGLFLFLTPSQRLSTDKQITATKAFITPATTLPAFPSVYDPVCANFNRSVVTEFYLNYTATHLLFDTHYSPSHIIDRSVEYHFAVVTAPNSFKARRSIRATWKRMITSQAACSSTLAFYVGKTGNAETAKWLDRELRQNPDDMVLINFCDAYENLPLKTYNIMHFVTTHLAGVEWVVKMDDDMLPNVPGFVQCFPQIQELGVGLYGWISIDKVPKDGDKYMIPRQRYGKSHFPPFTHGPTYAVRTSVLPRLLNACRSMPIINLEDVWFTGLCAEKAGVARKNVTRFLSMHRLPHEFDAQPEVAIQKGLFFHKISSVTVRKVWSTMNAQSCDRIDYSCDRFTKPLFTRKVTAQTGSYLIPVSVGAFNFSDV